MIQTEKTGRREREFLAHREEILLAAQKVFAAKGFFPTTMSDIAREAEFGTGTLYKYFKSKEDLYFTLIDEKTDEINRLVKAELSQKTSAAERIRTVLKLQFEFFERNRTSSESLLRSGAASSGQSKMSWGRASMRK